MSPSRHALAALMLSALGTPATAQPFTIQDGSMSFRWTAAPFVGGFSDVGASGSTCSNADNLFAWHWCYAIAGGAGVVLGDSGHGSYSQTVNPLSATQSIADVGQLGAFDAQVIDRVQAISSDAGNVRHELTGTNISGNALSLKLYLFVDVDHNGDIGNFSLSGSGSDRFIVSSLNACGGCIEAAAKNPDHFLAASITDPSRPELLIAAGADLSDRGLPFASRSAPDDFTGAFQWTLSLAAGATATLRASVGHNDLVAGGSASSTNSGSALGGANGPPRLSSGVPLLGAPLTISISNAGPGSAATLLFGAPGPGVTLPNCAGLTMSLSLVLSAVPISLNAAGDGSLTLEPSLCDLTSAQVPFGWQAFATEPNSPACLPLIHSDLLTTIFGD